LNIEPEPNDLVELLAQQPPPLDCRAVWTFEPNRDVSSSTNGVAGRWFFYDRDVPTVLHTLRTLQGQRAYLINVDVAGQLQVTGRPVIRATQFNSRVSNLFGALVDASGGPLTFQEYFAHPTAAGKLRLSGVPPKRDIFSVVGQDLVRRQFADAIEPNQAYWVNVVDDFEYAGPLDVRTSANGLSFGRNTALRTLHIEVPASSTGRTLSVQARPCADLSGGACGGRAVGDDWLEYRDPASGFPGSWQPLAGGLTLVVPPDATQVDLDVRPQRAGAALTAKANRGSAVPPPLVVDIQDDQGDRAVIPADVTLEPVFGRWVGRAELTHVSTHPSVQDLPLEDAEAVPIGMTLLLDLPTPTAKASGVLPQLLDSVTVQTFRDGRPLQRRFTSILFDRPVDLIEDAGDPIDPFGTTGTLHGTLHILPEDPLNPYRHRYNPEHRKGYDITREITVKLQVQAPTNADENSGLDGTMGPQRLTGVYTEVITGMTNDSITVQGTFQLERLADDTTALMR